MHFLKSVRLFAAARAGVQASLGVLLLFALPAQTWACACGCGAFQVGDFAVYPTGSAGHGLIFMNWFYQDQSHNFNGGSSAPPSLNEDKRLRSSFYTAGVQYNLGGSWAVQLEVPFVDRTFSVGSEEDPGQQLTHRWNQMGDMKISGIYSGFFPDKSLGVTFGLRLPTGDFKETSPGIDIDRDSQVGYGSTDLLLGAYFTHALTSDDAWSFFVQSSLDLPVWTQDGYRPGVEASEAIGIYYNNWSVGEIMIQPIAQVIATHRSHDRGPNAADPVASGSDRIFLAPGVLIQRDAAMVQAVVELPVYNYVSGNQLVGNTLLKVMFGYRF